MALQNILIPNNYSLFCEEITFPASINPQTPLNYYEEFSFLSEFSGPCAPVNVQCKIVRVGHSVQLSIHPFSSMGNNISTFLQGGTAIPARFRSLIPQADTARNIVLITRFNGAGPLMGCLVVDQNSGIMQFQQDLNLSAFTAGNAIGGPEEGAFIFWNI